jgi:protein gp37
VSATSTIEWTDATWNPVTGCRKVSPGCDHCYAETFAERWRGIPGHPYEQGFDVRLWPQRLTLPLRWRKPRKVFVNSMSDLFIDDVGDDYIAQVFAVMVAAPRHTFQVLTKRHARLRSLLSNGAFWQAVSTHLGHMWNTPAPAPLTRAPHWVWVGVSAETQQWADIRLPALAETPAEVRFVSAEPLLGPMRIRPDWLSRLRWVIAGGESGPGARPMHPDWPRTLRDQCAAAGVAFFFKQWGEYLPAPVVDAPTSVNGRAVQHPDGSAVSASIRDRGPSGTFRAGAVRAMRPGDRNGLGVMLDPDTIAVRVGKGHAGRLLDGRTHDDFPALAHRQV